MTVKEIIPNILCLEYRQDREDKDYGTCLWARFMFNLDRYEMTITSDCGNYGYKWCETPDSESFLELMVRCEKEYILNKIYGNADIFDYKATKEHIYECCCYDDEDKAKLDRIFEDIELDYEPNEAIDFMRKFDEEMTIILLTYGNLHNIDIRQMLLKSLLYLTNVLDRK